jgi:hypothetical protein
MTFDRFVPLILLPTTPRRWHSPVWFFWHYRLATLFSGALWALIAWTIYLLIWGG